MPRGRRTFTSEFKARVVLEFLSGTGSQAELCRRHQINPQLLTNWKNTFLERAPNLFGGDETVSQDQSRIGDLEQLVGRQALELEILKKASRLLNGRSSNDGRSL